MEQLEIRRNYLSEQINVTKSLYENLKSIKSQLILHNFEKEEVEKIDDFIKRGESLLEGLENELDNVKNEINEIQMSCKHVNCEYLGFGGHRDLWQCKDCGYILRY